MSFSPGTTKGEKLLPVLLLLLFSFSFSQTVNAQPSASGKTKTIRETVSRGWTVSIPSGVTSLQADLQGNVYCLKIAYYNNEFHQFLLKYVNDSIWADVTPDNISEELKELRVTEKGRLLLMTDKGNSFAYDGTNWQPTQETALYRFRDKELPHFLNDASLLKYPANRDLMYLRNKGSNEISLYEKINGQWTITKSYGSSPDHPVYDGYDNNILLVGEKLFCHSDNGVWVFDPNSKITRITKEGPVDADCTVYKDTIRGKWNWLESCYLRYLAVDSKCNMYSVLEESNRNSERVYQLVNDHWILLPAFGYGEKRWITNLFVNTADELVVYADVPADANASSAYHYFVFRQGNWVLIDGAQGEQMKAGADDAKLARCTMKNGTSPTDLYPSFIEKGTAELFINQRSRCLAIGNPAGKSWTNRKILIEWNGTQWNKLLEFDDQLMKDFVLNGDKLYAHDATALWYCDLKKTEIKERRTYKILPVAIRGPYTADGKFYTPDLPKDIGIYKQNGKLGLRSVSGRIIAYPVFDSITFELVPHPELQDKDHQFMFHLKGAGMDFYCSADNLDPDKITGTIASKTPCSTCGGSGRLKDEVERLPDKVWVSQSASSTSGNYERVWDSGCNCYFGVQTKTTTTTTGGYYKDNGYKTVVTPGGICAACEGGKRAVKVELNNYIYDPIAKKYKLSVSSYYEKAVQK